MHLNHLAISQFKNCTEASLEFSGNINCFVGRNGAGKTNILDAIYYLAFCKSYFNLSDTQNIQHDSDFFALNGTFSRDDRTDLVQCHQRRNAPKRFSLNKKEYDRLADHIGLFPLVMVSPYDRDLINDGSELRRKYIDGVIAQFDHHYLDNLLTYNKALAQRNALLKKSAETGFFDRPVLQLYDAMMEQPAQHIHMARVDFLKAFKPVFQHFYSWISEGREKVEINYETTMSDISFQSMMEINFERDKALRYTSAGIHKDDLSLLIDGYPVKKFGSQGQQKSFVVAMKLAQFEYTHHIKKLKPIMLFDDIFDKLDATRVKKIVELVGNDSFGQVFITDTQPERIEAIFTQTSLDHRIFDVTEGIVNQRL